jgi:hypothetical protein
VVTSNIDADYDGWTDAGTTTDTSTSIGVALGTFAAELQRSFLRFPLGVITLGATVSDVTLQFNVIAEDVEAGEGVNIRPYNTNGDDDPDAATGSVLATQDCSSTGSKTGIDLGATADSQVAGNISSPGWYSLGMTHLSLDSSEEVTVESIENAGSDPATLTVVWTAAAAGFGSLVTPRLIRGILTNSRLVS